MRASRFIFASLFALAIAFAPALAEARAGSSSSIGSSGSRTYSAPPSTRTAPSTVSPMQRSMTPQTAPSSPSYAPAPARPGLFGGSPFMSGLMGGLIGAGIGGLLFGGGMFHGVSGFGGFLGLLIQIFLVVMVVRFLFRMFFGGSRPAMAGGPAMFTPAGGAMPMGGGAPAQPVVAIQPADYQAFEHLLQGVQAAWSNHDVRALSGMSTPEMASYFAEQLSDQVSRGVVNTVTDVRLDQGDLADSWAENGREYARVAMKFSMVDVTRDNAGKIVDGNPAQRSQATEVWTFVRAAGGHWLLSAIQQAG
jgi:predicted lipid-binding transport protein (Tim44 family)